MHKLFLAGLVAFFPVGALASTECEIVDALKIVKEFVCENSTGSVYHSNGAYAGSKGGSWYDFNGNYIGSFSNLSEIEQLKMVLDESSAIKLKPGKSLLP